MAKRPAFFSINKLNKGIVSVEEFDFNWYPGFSFQQKQKSVKSLHDSILKKYPYKKILEVSTKSSIECGVLASAFNLMLRDTKTNTEFTVEQIFQSSKVFKNSGSQSHLLDSNMDSKSIKKTIKEINEKDELINFSYNNEVFELEPKTYFYNWIYINALNCNYELSSKIVLFDVFTDIEFNPNRSINSQAEACAIYKSLYDQKLLEDALSSKYKFLEIVYGKKIKTEQLSFF